MKVSVESGVFLKGIQTLQNVISTRSTLPILSNTLIQTTNNTLQLSGTDLEIGIQTTIPAQIHEPGSTTIPAKRLSDLLKELPQHPVTLTVKKNHITILECGNSQFKLMGIPPEEFPQLPTIETQQTLQIPQQMLLNMLTLTGFAMSHDETRYILNGVFCMAKKGRLRLVATDGRRLAMVERPIPQASHAEFHAIIPMKAVHELHRLLGTDEMMTIAAHQTQIKFDLGTTTIISRTIEGDFPNYEQVIPPEAHEKVR